MFKELYRWWEGPLSIEELHLVAWHHLINDSYVSTYTFENGVEQRSYVNAGLAWKRSVQELSRSFNRMAQQVRDGLFPALAGLADTFQEFGKKLDQSGLYSSLVDPDAVE